MPALQPVLGVSQPRGAALVLNPAPAGKLHTAACSCPATSVVNKVTDKCFVKWMVVLQRLHIIKHKWRHEWSINAIILWSCMKESFGAVLVLCWERVPGYCTHVILSFCCSADQVSETWVWGVLSETWTICFWGLFTTEAVLASCT